MPERKCLSWFLLQDLSSKKILALYVAMKHQVWKLEVMDNSSYNGIWQVTYSAEMEYFSLRTLLNWFQSIGLDVRMLVTDRYLGPKKWILKTWTKY